MHKEKSKYPHTLPTQRSLASNNPRDPPNSHGSRELPTQRSLLRGPIAPIINLSIIYYYYLSHHESNESEEIIINY